MVAKTHKIADRLADERAGRLNDKDAGDLVRLMMVHPAATIAATMDELLGTPTAVEATNIGLDHLRRQFGTRTAPGVEMAVRALTGALAEDYARDLCTAYTRRLLGRLGDVRQ